MRKLPLALMVLGALLTIPPAAGACIHEQSGEPKVVQPALRVMVAHAAGREVLVWAPTMKAGYSPKALSLVTATPTMPTHYGTTTLAALDRLDELFYPPLQAGHDGDIGSFGPDAGSNSKGIEVHPEVKTGPYAITPITATGSDGVAALNEWLKTNGFAEVSQAIALYYVQQDWTFLAVKIAPDGSKTGLESGKLPALELAFASPELVVPLKMEAGMGPLHARIYMAVAGTLDPNKALAGWGFDAVNVRSWSQAPTAVTDWIGELGKQSKLPATSAQWQLYATESHKLNTGVKILDWDTDFALAVSGQDGPTAPGQDGGGVDGGGSTPPSTATPAAVDGGCTAGSRGMPAAPLAMMMMVLALGVVIRRAKVR